MDLKGLGEALSKPATTLIERLADGAGILYEPRRIRARALAEGDASVTLARARAEVGKIEAASQLELSGLEQRALQRLIGEEAWRQKNIEAVIDTALPLLEDVARPEDIGADWLVDFFDRARMVSDSELQEVWARLLAGEAQAPGTFSKQTVTVLSSLSRQDAELFSSLCRYCVELHEPAPLIYDTRNEIYRQHNVGFVQCTHLDALGLITFQPIAGFKQLGLARKGWVPYLGSRIYVELPEEDGTGALDLGQVVLTQVGRELYRLVDPQPVEGFPDYLRATWLKRGYAVEPQTKP